MAGLVGTLVGNLKAYAPLHASAAASTTNSATASIAWPSTLEDSNGVVKSLRGSTNVAVVAITARISSYIRGQELAWHSQPLKERIAAIEGAGVGQGRHGTCTFSTVASGEEYREYRRLASSMLDTGK